MSLYKRSQKKSYLRKKVKFRQHGVFWMYFFFFSRNSNQSPDCRKASPLSSSVCHKKRELTLLFLIWTSPGGRWVYFLEGRCYCESLPLKRPSSFLSLAPLESFLHTPHQNGFTFRVEVVMLRTLWWTVTAKSRVCSKAAPSWLSSMGAPVQGRLMLGPCPAASHPFPSFHFLSG